MEALIIIEVVALVTASGLLTQWPGRDVTLSPKEMKAALAESSSSRESSGS